MTTRWQPPLISHARDRHPAYAKKLCCLFQVQQRLVNGGIGLWRRQGIASGERASARPEYPLEYARQRHHTVGWRRRGQRRDLVLSGLRSINQRGRVDDDRLPPDGYVQRSSYHRMDVAQARPQRAQGAGPPSVQEVGAAR